ncbi:energy-coupling factor transporter transmembrane protein EcfT [bacterium]|nr:energy-coupling factor transporter transmembrane protein EcfT [bacterium]
MSKLHPAIRIAVLILLFCTPFAFNDPLFLAPLGLLFLVLSLFAQAWSNIVRVRWLGLVFLVMSLLLWPLFFHGPTPLFVLGPVTITKEALLYGCSIGIRLNCFLLLGVIFLSITRLEDFTRGLTSLGLPYSLSFALGLAFRLSPLFAEEAERVVTAQKARGLDLDQGTIFARIKKHIPVIVPVLLLGLKKADLLSIALESKGFNPSAHRTYYYHYALRLTDLVVIVLVLVLNTGLFMLRYLGYGLI